MLVVSCLQSLSFDTSLSPAASSGKAALVRLYYQRDWAKESPPPRSLPSSGGGGGQFEELVNAAAVTVKAANVLSSSDNLRFFCIILCIIFVQYGIYYI
jgi:hypothetical protein